MKKLDLGQILSLLANAGVIGGLLLLAVQIRQSNDLIADEVIRGRADSVQSIFSQYVAWHAQIAGDSSVADIYENGLIGFDQLSDTDKARFDSLMRSYLRIASQVLQGRRVGVMFANEDNALQDRQLEGDLLRHLDYPGFRQWWSQADKRGVSRLAQELIEDLEKQP